MLTTTTRTISVAPDPELDDVAAQLELDSTIGALAKTAKRIPTRRALGKGETQGEHLARAAAAVAEAAGNDPRTDEPYYTAADVLSWVGRAVAMGCKTPRLGPTEVQDVARFVRVPNAKLRAEYERRTEEGEKGLASKLAEAIGAERTDKGDQGGSYDETYALRVLGVEPVQQGRSGKSLRLFMPYEQAVAMADVLELSYHDLGV